MTLRRYRHQVRVRVVSQACVSAPIAEMSSSALLTEDVLSKASQITVYAADGSAVKFGDLYSARETIVVFIR